MNSIIGDKSKAFAIRIINLYKYLQTEKNEYVLSKQLLRSGTSIGANAAEGNRGQTKPDFYSKMNIALKEAEETSYWLDLLHETNYLTDDEFADIHNDCEELIKILVAITKKQKE